MYKLTTIIYILILLTISILPIYLIAKYIYNKDTEKEPTNLLIKLFIGGIISVILTIIITSLLEMIFPIFQKEPNQLNLLELLFYILCGTALIEETTKWIITYLISYNNKEFDQFYDMIIYATFVSLGFACIENILYVLSSGIKTGIFRGLLSVPGHACNGIFMGYYLGLSKISKINNNTKLSRKNLTQSIIIPTILHTIYDFCIYSKKIYLIIIFFIFIITLYKYSLKKINTISNIKSKIK